MQAAKALPQRPDSLSNFIEHFVNLNRDCIAVLSKQKC
ncbi:hypothetical protein D8I24_7919 [Cupriavidus necator H850]|nr:hypothetical protein D8I24_7919 [Cupriavidus necator H850]